MQDFDSLYRDFAPRVFRFVLSLSGSREVAEDVTAETFVRVWTARERVRHDTVLAFLFAIARNLWLQGARRDARHHPVQDDHAAPGPQPDVEAIGRLDLARTLAQLRGLEADDRAAILMRAQEGMGYEAIGQALGITAGAARVRVHRARKRLLVARHAAGAEDA